MIDKTVATRLDGMLTAIRGSLNGFVAHAQDDMAGIDEEMYALIVESVSHAMVDTIDISNALYKMHPSIFPKELQED